ncbi:MAG: hypothetical protein ACO2O0_07825 [Desulfurococcales archaeon]|jgi:hypothetical protein
MVEKILRRSRDPRKIPRKTAPNTQTYEGAWTAIYSHQYPQAPLTKKPASKEAKQETG